MKDQYANYVVQKIFETSNDRQRELLLNRIRVHFQALRKYTYGKHIVARFEQLSGEGKHPQYSTVHFSIFGFYFLFFCALIIYFSGFYAC